MPEAIAEHRIEEITPARIYTKTTPRPGEPDEKNLDAVGGFPEDGLVVVCDGVSSCELSGSASQGVLDFLANPHVRNLLNVKTPNAMQEVMKELFSMIARFIYMRSLAAGEEIFTTTVIAKRWVDQRGRLVVTIAHLGNSRAYLHTGKSFKLRTVDDTEMVNYLKTVPGSIHGMKEWLMRIDGMKDAAAVRTFFSELGLTAMQAQDFLEGSSQITAALGLHPDRSLNQMTPTVSTFVVKPGDELWLITDGGHGNVLFDEAQSIACSGNPLEDRVNLYVETAHGHMQRHDGPVLGGPDDIGVGVLVV